MRLRLPVHAGGIDEPKRAIVPAKLRVDRVARRAGRLRDQRALLAEQRVDQRALPDVRPSDDGQRELCPRGRRCGPLAAARARRSGRADRPCPRRESPRRRSVPRSPAPRTPREPKRPRCRRFGLVGDENERAAFAPQDPRDVVVERMKPGLRVDDHNDDVGLPRRRLRPAGASRRRARRHARRRHRDRFPRYRPG